MALRELRVENLAVIESVALRLAPGFTVLTGETGAGKSLVVDAVALALGARASSDVVRDASDAARVEAIFDAPPAQDDDPLADQLAAGEGMAIITREVSADGRSIARLNDRAVTIGSLASLGARLGEIHGQHDQQRLLEPMRQLTLVDAYGGLAAAVALVRERYAAWRAAVAASGELVTDPRELARRVELLEHQSSEIAAAKLRAGEDAELEAQLRISQNAELIASSAAVAVERLRDDGGVVDGLSDVERGLSTAAQHDPRFADLADRAAALAAEASELARDAAAAADAVDVDPRARDTAEERLALLYDLRRKYGETLEAVIAFGESATDELERLRNQEDERERLRGEEIQRRAALDEAAASLSEARRDAARRLTDAVNAELPPLGLRAGSFGVDVEPIDVGPSGADAVTFAFAPNAGEPSRPLSRIASGGEASRLSLAIKVALAAADETPLLVFDEIDAGVGGRNASALGARLRELSRFHQVLCVTHMAQVAAHADAHIRVGKRVVEGRTVTDAIGLAGPERATELAAMLAGEGAGHEAHAAAEALLRAAQ